MWFCTLVWGRGGDRVDQVQTIRQVSSVWLWEAVQRVLKATFKCSVFGDSALDCESKNLPRATHMSANLPGRVTVNPSGAFL